MSLILIPKLIFTQFSCYKPVSMNDGILDFEFGLI